MMSLLNNNIMALGLILKLNFCSISAEKKSDGFISHMNSYNKIQIF